ncbi:uncharacterized protein Gasu_23420 [Galdieria sulphuraria]|uniref:Uncharacterized protein n=1 Tax=Galdieria sulphuraria TaxID=130081 RepID=M2X249_GALSU|nr:uncharacterized protein Gasu_23420 [Galdieria sulphuraria]EME30440.1 hypothetical protein Gasu_23420 [Galdieria sulphuraria]|eukprot:XP_005706960.1 hypothetical protein Gasu_23420 [Galdieria sulphuraria]
MNELGLRHYIHSSSSYYYYYYYAVEFILFSPRVKWIIHSSLAIIASSKQFVPCHFAHTSGSCGYLD